MADSLCLVSKNVLIWINFHCIYKKYEYARVELAAVEIKAKKKALVTKKKPMNFRSWAFVFLAGDRDSNICPILLINMTINFHKHQIYPHLYPRI